VRCLKLDSAGIRALRELLVFIDGVGGGRSRLLFGCFCKASRSVSGRLDCASAHRHLGFGAVIRRALRIPRKPMSRRGGCSCFRFHYCRGCRHGAHVVWWKRRDDWDGLPATITRRNCHHWHTRHRFVHHRHFGVHDFRAQTRDVWRVADKAVVAGSVTQGRGGWGLHGRSLGPNQPLAGRPNHWAEERRCECRCGRGYAMMDCLPGLLRLWRSCCGSLSASSWRRGCCRHHGHRRPRRQSR